MDRKFKWDAPAKLFFWPAEDGFEEEATYPTLYAALRAAAEGELSLAWIITEAGEILTPRMIQSLRDERSTPRRRSVGRALFPWARAA